MGQVGIVEAGHRGADKRKVAALTFLASGAML
jgi:hypothetical protein